MKKNLTFIVAIFSFIALVGTGFASWIVTRPTQNATQTGSVVTQTVTDKTVQLGVDLATGEDGRIIFGAPAEKAEEYTEWLENDETVDFEKLSVKLDITVTGIDDISKTDEDNVTFMFEIISVADSTSSEKNAAAMANFEYCLTKGYIGGPVLKIGGQEIVGSANTWTIEKSYFSQVGETSEVSCQVTLEFSWGSAFGSETPVNPYDYYNSQAYTEDLADEAVAVLEDINTKLADVAFKVTVSA